MASLERNSFFFLRNAARNVLSVPADARRPSVPRPFFFSRPLLLFVDGIMGRDSAAVRFWTLRNGRSQ
jgi:hypothetical protein